jgi:tRNA nucleotidyltransferase (CCA-adding enzyme)
MGAPDRHAESIAEALDRMHPELRSLRGAGGDPVYLVGGAVRDLLLGRGRADIDLVVEGDAAAFATGLGAEVTSHERFGTAKVRLDGHELDIAGTRSEAYPRPGALPEVQTGAGLEQDLARRDFTINAMAIPLHGDPELIDPFGGEADLAAKQLRILHPRSFIDDPTRALRAARYAARFGFELEPETADPLRRADLGTVSTERRQVELLRVAGEAEAPRAFELLAEWGQVELRKGGVALASRVTALLATELWGEVAPREQALLRAALGPPGQEETLASAQPRQPSEAVELAARCGPLELLLARALGAEWLDRYLSEWREVALEIDGEDLMKAGIPQGPAVGRGLQAALRRKLDGEVAGREQELAAALEAAGRDDGVA